MFSKLSTSAMEFVPGRANVFGARNFSSSFDFAAGSSFSSSTSLFGPNSNLYSSLTSSSSASTSFSNFNPQPSTSSKPFQIGNAFDTNWSLFGTQPSTSSTNVGFNLFQDPWQTADYSYFPNTFPPVSFDLMPTYNQSNLALTNNNGVIGQPMSRAHACELYEVKNRLMDANVRSIWSPKPITTAAVAVPNRSSMSTVSSSVGSDLISRFRDASISSDDISVSSEEFNAFNDFKTSSSSSFKKHMNNEEENRNTRTIVGRRSEYYQRFGFECLQIPKDALINFGPNMRVPALPAPNNRNKSKPTSRMECVFCKNISQKGANNSKFGEQINPESYKTHWLKDAQGIIVCPVLRKYQCPLCGNQGGDQAHTMRYCPKKRLIISENYQRAKSSAAAKSTADPSNGNQMF